MSERTVWDRLAAAGDGGRAGAYVTPAEAAEVLAVIDGLAESLVRGHRSWLAALADADYWRRAAADRVPPARPRPRAACPGCGGERVVVPPGGPPERCGRCLDGTAPDVIPFPAGGPPRAV